MWQTFKYTSGLRKAACTGRAQAGIPQAICMLPGNLRAGVCKGLHEGRPHSADARDVEAAQGPAQCQRGQPHISHLGAPPQRCHLRRRQLSITARQPRIVDRQMHNQDAKFTGTKQVRLCHDWMSQVEAWQRIAANRSV